MSNGLLWRCPDVPQDVLGELYRSEAWLKVALPNKEAGHLLEAVDLILGEGNIPLVFWFCSEFHGKSGQSNPLSTGEGPGWVKGKGRWLMAASVSILCEEAKSSDSNDNADRVEECVRPAKGLFSENRDEFHRVWAALNT